MWCVRRVADGVFALCSGVKPVNKLARVFASSRRRKEPELSFVAHVPNGTRRSLEDASSTYNTSTRRAQQTLERKRKCRRVQNLPAHGHYYMPAVGPVKRHVHHGRATCDAREPVCLHEDTPGELAPLKLIRPGALSRSGQAIATLSLERRRAVAYPGAHARRSASEISNRSPLNQGKIISC